MWVAPNSHSHFEGKGKRSSWASVTRMLFRGSRNGEHVIVPLDPPIPSKGKRDERDMEKGLLMVDSTNAAVGYWMPKEEFDRLPKANTA